MSADGSQASNIVDFAMFGNPGTFSQDSSTGTYYQIERSFVRIFNPDFSSAGSFQPGANLSVAVDNETHKIVMSQPAGADTFSVYKSPTDPNPVGATNGNPAMEVDNLNHVGCGAQWTANQIACLDLSQDIPTITTSPLGVVGNQPWLLRRFDVSGVSTAVTYNRGDAQVCSYAISLWTETWCVTLPGFTKSGDITAGNMINAGWEMIPFRSGPLANTVAVFSRYDHLVAFVNVAVGAVVGQPVSLSGDPFQIAANEVTGTAVVAFADVDAMLNRFSVIDPIAGTTTELANTWTNLATVFWISPDGLRLYLANRDQSQVIPNQ